MQIEDPAAATFPGSQLVQEVAPAVEYVFIPQVKHDVDLVFGLYLPASHKIQSPPELGLYFPAGQETHTPDPFVVSPG